MSEYEDRDSMLQRGILLYEETCELNRIKSPKLRVLRGRQERKNFWACGWFSPPHSVTLFPERCARIGVGGRAWSFPGYVVDRTPFGVLQHENGHHFDFAFSKDTSFSLFAHDYTEEPAITGYAPNESEWFAEMFRLFITNPDLLRLIRPKTWELLGAHFVSPEKRGWQRVLALAPERTFDAAASKVERAGS